MSSGRILITDAQERSVLAAVRCLGDAGYRVTASAGVRLAPGLWSRRCSARRRLPDPRAGLEAFLTRLEALLRDERHDLLLPGTDASLYAISIGRARLEPHIQGSRTTISSSGR
jgi:hypothetical protein